LVYLFYLFILKINKPSANTNLLLNGLSKLSEDAKRRQPTSFRHSLSVGVQLTTRRKEIAARRKADIIVIYRIIFNKVLSLCLAIKSLKEYVV